MDNTNINDFLLSFDNDIHFNKIFLTDTETLQEIKKLATMYATDQLNNLNETIDNKRLGLSDLLIDETEDSSINRLKYKISGLGIAKEEIRRLINDIKDSNE